MEGRIHSFESMGLVDGPGIRCVIFFQGCKLRCRYCHNPDTWNMDNGKIIDSEKLMNKIIRLKPYFHSNSQSEKGGVTFSGGEPLLQPEFLLTLLKRCKEEGIHTCLDTAGFGFGDYSEILKYTDLILYDVKETTNDTYFSLTHQDISVTKEFISAVKKTNIPLWVRHVVVPGITDGFPHMELLKKYIKDLPNVEKIELLPYHILGVSKYKAMHIPYSLDGIAPMDQNVLADYQNYFK